MCVICVTAKKSVESNAQLSRVVVGKLLEKHPKSPWWINNSLLANFYRIKNNGDMHNLAILGNICLKEMFFGNDV